MSKRATATFTLDKTYAGELAGTSVTRLLFGSKAEDSPAYGGFEIVTADLQGRKGTFMLHHRAAQGDQGFFDLTVLAGSGTGDLKGLTGSAQIEIDEAGGHTIRLDYDV
ncbi:DUF3224 domain-containing protein [Fodinicola acaciae]|uniref:DUF3224 domain-containing protein n=1 Tax=Fodinicola acaciae TaxID=2681555 RepID=UPI0013D5AACF|nr:DUF3224 domain-containing protein [Fodinicola acaciae]